MKNTFLLPMRAVVVTALLLLALSAPAHAGQFGVGLGNYGSTYSSGLRADFSRGSKVTITETSTLTTLCAWVYLAHSELGNQSMRLVLYRDANGAPGTKVAETAATVVGYPSGETLCYETTRVVVTAGSYWVMIHTGAPAGVLEYLSDDAVSNWYGGADTFADGAANTFGPGSAGTGSVSVGGWTSKTFGRTTVGTAPSGGLRADVSRGSKFTLNDGARVNELCAYLDGQAGGSGSQNVRLALYRDLNGVPGKKVGQSVSQAIVAGTAAAWKCFRVPYLLAAPGDYWIMVHSGGNASVARYYYDGPANWYGGNDAFADDSAEIFGPGSAGSGTLSAFATYSDGSPFTFGRTTVGTIPSSGMRANYKRASSATMEKGRVVSFSVYLDGLGGGTGTSQDVSFAAYMPDGSSNTTGGWEDPTNLMFVTKPITIPAGMSPQWVTAPLPLYGLPVSGPPGNYLPVWITIHSGNSAGIARFYHDGPGNFCAHADTFSDGTSALFGACEPGNGTISAYVSYEGGHTEAAASVGNQGDPPSATPSSGLSANFIGGSKFSVTEERAILGTIRAYLDGLGSGTGSQQVQVLVYDDSPEHKLVARSEIKSIVAGTQPNWVNFNAEPVYLVPGNYYVMLFSGGNAQVVRNYATSASNWIGVNANFASGPPAKLNVPLTVGSGTVLIKADLIVPRPEPYY